MFGSRSLQLRQPQRVRRCVEVWLSVASGGPEEEVDGEEVKEEVVVRQWAMEGGSGGWWLKNRD